MIRQNKKNRKNGSSEKPVRSIFFQTVRSNIKISIGLLLAIAGAIVLGLIPPLILGGIIDSLTLGRTVTAVSAVLYFSLLAAGGIMTSVREALITMFGQKMTHAIRTAMAEKLLHLPSDFFVTHESGDVTSLFVNDVDTLEDLFSSGVISMVSDLAGVVSVLLVIFTKSIGLGLLIAISAVVLFAMTRVFQIRTLNAQVENRRAIGRASAQIPETIRTIRMIHVFHAEKYMENVYDDTLDDSFLAMEKANFFDSIYSPIILTVSSVIIAVMMIGSGQGNAFRSFFGVTVGTAVALIAYVGKVFGPLESIGMEIQNIQSASAGLTRIREFFSLPEMQPAQLPSSDASSAQKDAVKIDHLSFWYDEADPIFTDYSLTVKKGETLILAGRTGVGKSTLFRLILGLYHPKEGTVRIFGSDPALIRPEERRHVFGCVEQTFRPVPGSLRDQITLGDPSVGSEDVQKALNLVGLDGIPMDKPLSESHLTRGQEQLLGIARAIVLDPRLLLLDEVTSSLDAGTEKTVLEALRAASEGRTVISISHRLYETGGAQVETLT